MKRYCYFALAAVTALTLSACKKTSSRTVVYTEAIPYLTTGTMKRETLPPDTYSEYAATRTKASESGGAFAIGGVSADTAVTAPPVQDNFSAAPVAADTVLPETAMPFTETSAAPETAVSDSSAQSSEQSETAENTEISGTSASDRIKLTVPSADTAVSGKISADTAPVFGSETETAANTSNGGTENAH